MSNISDVPPKSDIGDAAHTLGRALLSLIPVAGGPAVELFSTVITPPLSKRRDEWIISIVRGLKALEAKVEGFTIESLAESEALSLL